MKMPTYARPQQEIRSIFDRIAGKYDFLNSFLSFRQDKSWREKAVRKSLTRKEKSILDIGTGSGVFLEEFLNQHSFERAIGIDISPEMLTLARRRLGSRATLLLSEGPELPFHPSEFDIVSTAFVLRSLTDILAFFKEAHRVLSPGGRFVILELTRPTKPAMKMLYHSYLNWYLPLVGRIFSGSREAYQFLSSSIQKFYAVGEYVDFLKLAGFETIHIHSMTGGVCTLVIAEKKK
ncbi:MAG: ubiquinone/menaquinone biosynthesis methyltransferase [Candidatus Omnitrophica bacterium]|nr:ubiquinone/menaquinone biosynthesis methyltransferase [Candidatus Omnitrophota bacterium]